VVRSRLRVLEGEPGERGVVRMVILPVGRVVLFACIRAANAGLIPNQRPGTVLDRVGVRVPLIQSRVLSQGLSEEEADRRVGSGSTSLLSMPHSLA